MTDVLIRRVDWKRYMCAHRRNHVKTQQEVHLQGQERGPEISEEAKLDDNFILDFSL